MYCVLLNKNVKENGIIVDSDKPKIYFCMKHKSATDYIRKRYATLVNRVKKHESSSYSITNDSSCAVVSYNEGDKEYYTSMICVRGSEIIDTLNGPALKIE